MDIPLAESLRPEYIEEVIGQEHLLGKGKPLNVAFAIKKLHSMILWGPPGVGKTTIARLIAQGLACDFISLSAVFSGVKDIRNAVDKAKENQKTKKSTILFIDEIHRFNKAQQDALLPYTESGLVTFIGATTENPSFEVNSALLSRAQVYILKSLTDKDLSMLIERAQMKHFPDIGLDKDAADLFIAFADGDARRLYNVMQQTVLAARAEDKKQLTKKMVENSLSSGKRRFDKGGDRFYDQISALHKSVRGSNPDASLYWLCCMLDGGADPHYLARRIIRMAWEDIGLADPRAIEIAQHAAQTYERLGSPEGELALAQAVIYLSVAAKSNAGYKAFNQAMAFVKKDKSREVPLHLRNAPTSLMKESGYGKDYRYAHDEPDAYAAGEHYFPEDMKKIQWYRPVDRGLEAKISEKLRYLNSLNDKKKSK